MTIRTYGTGSGPRRSASVTMNGQSGRTKVRCDPAVGRRISNPASRRTRRRSSKPRSLRRDDSPSISSRQVSLATNSTTCDIRSARPEPRHVRRQDDRRRGRTLDGAPARTLTRVFSADGLPCSTGARDGLGERLDVASVRRRRDVEPGSVPIEVARPGCRLAQWTCTGVSSSRISPGSSGPAPRRSRSAPGPRPGRSRATDGAATGRSTHITATWRSTGTWVTAGVGIPAWTWTTSPRRGEGGPRFPPARTG